MIKLYDKNKELFAELNYGKEYYQNYALHSHESFCFSLLAKGEVHIKIHKKENQILKTNMLVVFNPNESHKTSKTPIKAYDYFTLHLNKDWCMKLQNQVLKKDMQFIKIENFIYNEELYNNFLEIFMDLSKNKNRYKDLENSLKKLFKNYTLENKKLLTNENKLINKIEENLIQNLYTNISLEDLANNLGYTSSYLTRIFKEKHGLSPHAFLVNKRVEKARVLLLENKNINLASLSQEVCFYDQSHFTKAFKKNYAISPKKYIKCPKIY